MRAIKRYLILYIPAVAAVATVPFSSTSMCDFCTILSILSSSNSEGEIIPLKFAPFSKGRTTFN